ncbi:type I restriction-modification system endonuclease [Methylobacterium aquaticum]|uniref:type I restriction-modification system endonuclease n=1 Tax=Methylobacterium aquaticum TaxID=270351 RepID=UPI003D1711BC
MPTNANFGFLNEYDATLVALPAQAETYFRTDPSTALIKLRQFAELLTKEIAARHGAYQPERRETFESILTRLSYEHILPRETADLFHGLRRLGNDAVHEAIGTHADALSGLKLARQIAIWFHRTYGRRPDFRPGPFVPPAPPIDAAAALRDEINALRQRLVETQDAAETAKYRAEQEARERESLNAHLAQEQEERAIWEALAQENEAAKTEMAARLAALQAEAVQAPKDVLHLLQRAEEAAKQIDLDEADTRALIDRQLRDCGWEADTHLLRYSEGTRPTKGRNLAIAEWPTVNGRADYALFVGTTLVGVVEAKRQRKNVSAAIDQAERYARGITSVEGGGLAVGAPWIDGAHQYGAPFVFAANGRVYLKQIETESGIWFRDVRKPTNLRRALVDWSSPEGLLGKLEIDTDAAAQALKSQPMAFGFPLRSYQRDAVTSVEEALEAGRRSLLVAMATGTGKTKTAIALLYRLLAAKRFRRVCFVVDRSALGLQTEGEFSTTKVIAGHSFADIFGLKGLGEISPAPETKLHICTIQSLVKRILLAPEPSQAPAIDQYDLVVVDECHRGYLLDRELSDAELSFRDEADYISKYRRVLDYFDAVKIGLTATPALHTTDIFGEPIFTYSYREAVIDDFLVDHEPPIRIETALARTGITFGKSDQLEMFNTVTGEVDLAHTPDDLHFEVEQFNKAVITQPFNRVVAKELARHIDPALPGKTLIFAATDAHADIVVTQIKAAFAAAYGEIDDAAVKKITGSVDKVQDLIRAFRNDANPKIVVTVDLLTTGIDVPSITNLVFLRRVNSRILYEQMIGRATRLCPGIGKEVFRIFDAVDLYPYLQAVTAMKPVVVNPTISFAQLVDELASADTEVQRETVRAHLLVKLRRRLKHLPEAARGAYEGAAGETPEATLARLHAATGDELVAWVMAHRSIGSVLDRVTQYGAPRTVPISHHPDEVVAVTRGYGTAAKPEDFLDGFAAFVRENVNTIAALKVVVQRPRDLTRAQLRALRLELDQRGFSEANLKRAWNDARNEEIAASIIGFVRQAALGDPLVPYAERVGAAMRRILSRRPWTEPQKQWLKRIGEQVATEIVVDREALDQEPFKKDGGFNRLNRIFDGGVEAVLADVNEELWQQAS